MSAFDPKRTFVGICGSARDEVTHHPNRSDRLPAGRLLFDCMSPARPHTLPWTQPTWPLDLGQRLQPAIR